MKFLLLLIFAVPCFAQANKDLSLTERSIYAHIVLIELKPETCTGTVRILENDCSEQAKQLGLLYGQAVRYPELVKRLLGDAAHRQLDNPVNKESLRMNSLLIAQNQRIIELLETIAKKPK